jgi:hypothetical protein
MRNLCGFVLLLCGGGLRWCDCCWLFPCALRVWVYYWRHHPVLALVMVLMMVMMAVHRRVGWGGLGWLVFVVHLRVGCCRSTSVLLKGLWSLVFWRGRFRRIVLGGYCVRRYSMNRTMFRSMGSLLVALYGILFSLQLLSFAFSVSVLSLQMRFGSWGSGNCLGGRRLPGECRKCATKCHTYRIPLLLTSRSSPHAHLLGVAHLFGGDGGALSGSRIRASCLSLCLRLF